MLKNVGREEFPKELETVLLAYLKQNYLNIKAARASKWGPKDVEYFGRGITRLNEVLALERGDRHQDYFKDPVLRSGYLAYFFPVNFMKAYGLIEASDLVSVPKNQEVTIVDLGAGPLTFSLAVLVALIKRCPAAVQRGITINITAYEQNSKILEDGKAIMAAYLSALGLKSCVQVHLRVLKGRVTSKNELPHADWILMGNFLNELPNRDLQQKLVEIVLNRWMGSDTQVLIVEPAAKKSSRDVQALRDFLIEEQNIQILGPCLHREKCPLNLIAKGDWCHATAPWVAPKFIQDFDEEVGLRKTFLLYSYLLFRKGTVQPKVNRTYFRVISDLFEVKDGQEWIGCGSHGRIRFKHPGMFQKGLSYFKRGNLVAVQGYEGDGRHQIDGKYLAKSRNRVDVV